MFYRFRTNTARALHDRVTASVRDLPPLKIVDSDLRIATMCSTRDLQMFLVAARSFYRQLGHGRFVILDDGSFTADDRALLKEKLGAEIHPIAAVDTGPCPKGGCWERLLSIIGLTDRHYVIQLDSDTLTRGPVDEVAAAVRDNRSFTLGTRMGREFVDARTIRDVIAKTESDHIQVAFERAMADMPGMADARYVRGSAGFAGFARGGFPLERIHQMSSAAQATLGKRWTEWGSEQVMSNLVVANSADSVILQPPRYINYYLQPDWPDASFIHFVGSHRYARMLYTRQSHAFLRRERAMAG